MIALLWTRDEASGILDEDSRENDVLKVLLDADEATLGGIEKKSYLAIKIPDPPNIANVMTALVEPEYKVTEDPAETKIRRKRSFFVTWRSKFNADEIAIIEDQTQQFVDGPLVSGGSVVSGVIYDKFTIEDFIRK